MSAESASPDDERRPVWSLGTALLFVVAWMLLLVTIQIASMSAAAAILALVRYLGGEAPVFDPRATSVELLDESQGPGGAIIGAACVFLAWLVTFGLVSRLFAGFSRSQVLRALGLVRPTPPWSMALAVPAGAALLVVGNLIVQGLRVSEDPTVIERMLETPGGTVAVVGMAVVLAPAAEEVFFRGFVFPPMARRFSAGTAMAMNGAVFALVHLLTYGRELAYLPPIFLLGFATSGLRAWTGSVVPAIIAHFVFNGASLVLFFVLGPEPGSGT